MTTSSPTWFGRLRARMKAHKIWTTIIIVAVIVVGYEIYHAMAAGSATPQYAVSAAHIGNIVQTVSGTGQISAENQLDVTSQVSGAVKSINVAVGDHVTAGQLLATIDNHDAYISLQNAQIAYAKLTAPAKSGDLANAQNSVSKSYSDALNSVAGSFVDLSTIMSGLKSLLYSQGGYLSEAYSVRLNPSSHPMRDAAAVRYDAAANEYARVLLEYQSLNRNSPTSTVDAVITDTRSVLKLVADALQETQSAVTYIMANQPDYYTGSAAGASNNINSWIGTANSDLASLVSAQNAIASTANSLNTTLTGADTLDVQSQALSLQQAQDTYAKYFIRAPFDGIVGRLPVSVYTQASASTIIATVVGNQKIAVISLNEVDAAKVKVGQTVAITFDAIDGFTATGTVSQVDLVGTVSQGVVSYNIKISVNTQDVRILPGMSVNAVVTVNERDGALVVPSAAVKTQGNQKYVQVMASSTVEAYIRSAAASAGAPTGATSSTTRNFGGRSISLTIPSAQAPINQRVTVGVSDDANTEILSGLAPRDWVVTRTVSSSGATPSATPTLFSGLGGGARTGAGATGARTAVPVGR